MFEFAVIGAGVIGGMTARALTRYTKSVVILEKDNDVSMGATRANSAIVHAGFDAEPGTLKALLNVRGAEMMPAVTRDLGVKYKNNGSLVVGFSDEDRAHLEALKERGERNGVKGLRILSREEVRALEPNVGDTVTCALIAPTAGIVCPYELCIAAVGCAMDNGASLKLNFKVVKIEKIAGGYRIVSEDGNTVEAAKILDCAGVYSDEVAKMAGDGSFTVTPRRGEYFILDKVTGGTVSHTVFRCPSAMGKGILVTPTVDGNLMLGPTSEDIADKDDLKTTAAGLANVRRQASEQVKNIDFSKIITQYTGLRAVGSTHDFILRKAAEGFYLAAGIESPGLSSAPAIAEYLVDLIQKDGADLTARPDFVPTRASYHAFREMSEQEKAKVIAKDPTYAHVVCRCEVVTEGEILAAIRRNPRPTDIDGVKRRTRATMGRCQGGFCTPAIAALLAKEYGVDLGEITKSGGISRLNLSKTKENVR